MYCMCRIFNWLTEMHGTIYTFSDWNRENKPQKRWIPNESIMTFWHVRLYSCTGIHCNTLHWRTNNHQCDQHSILCCKSPSFLWQKLKPISTGCDVLMASGILFSNVWERNFGLEFVCHGRLNILCSYFFFLVLMCGSYVLFFFCTQNVDYIIILVQLEVISVII